MKSNKITVSGFEVGKYVEVKCDGDKITLSKTNPPEIKKVLLEEKVRMLDKKQRTKLANLIEKLYNLK